MHLVLVPALIRPWSDTAQKRNIDLPSHGQWDHMHFELGICQTDSSRPVSSKGCLGSPLGTDWESRSSGLRVQPLIRMPPARLPGKVLWACLTWRSLQGRVRTCWRVCVSQLTWEHLEIPTAELDKVSEESAVWALFCDGLRDRWLCHLKYRFHFIQKLVNILTSFCGETSTSLLSTTTFLFAQFLISISCSALWYSLWHLTWGDFFFIKMVSQSLFTAQQHQRDVLPCSAHPLYPHRKTTYHNPKSVTIATPCNIESKTECGKHCCCCCPNSKRWDQNHSPHRGHQRSREPSAWVWARVSVWTVWVWHCCEPYVHHVQEFVDTVADRVFEAAFCSNQASVKYLIEWMMILILVLYPHHMDSFWACFSKVRFHWCMIT